MNAAHDTAVINAVAKAIKKFPFDDYGLDEVDPKSKYAEWVPALAQRIVGALTKAGLQSKAQTAQDIARAIEAYEVPAHPAICPPSIAWEAGRERAATIAREFGTSA